MANGFLVNAATLRSLAEELRTLNEQYKTRVENLAAQEQELSTMWSGEAQAAFRQAFATDKVGLDQYKAVIDRYIQALEEAAVKYSEAEARATEIAKTRTH